MQVSKTTYPRAMQALSIYLKESGKSDSVKVEPDQFHRAAQMSYANKGITPTKAEELFKNLAHYLKSIRTKPTYHYEKGETVYIPDLHGDFVHMIVTLHRHGLLDEDLNLKKDYNYIFLGDFYNRGMTSDVIDYWLNKQIKRNVVIYRLSGNHELFFVARDKNGDPFKYGKPLVVPDGDVKNDKANGFQVTENLLRNIKDGNILAAFVSVDDEYKVPTSYAHSYLVNDDFEKLEVDTSDVLRFATVLNRRFKGRGKESYDCFMDCKRKGKFNWADIRAPFFTDPLFNILDIGVDGIRTSYLMRITGVPTKKKKIPPKLIAKVPPGVYQTVGHTRTSDFDLPRGYDTNKPIILPDDTGHAFVQFSDVSIGCSYKPRTFTRPEVIINKKFAEGV